MLCKSQWQLLSTQCNVPPRWPRCSLSKIIIKPVWFGQFRQRGLQMTSNESLTLACLSIKIFIKLIQKNPKCGKEAHFESSRHAFGLINKGKSWNSIFFCVGHFTRHHQKAVCFQSKMDCDKVIKSHVDDNCVSNGPHVALKPLDRTRQISTDLPLS